MSDFPPPSPISKSELFATFLKQVRRRAAQELSLDVLPGQIPNTIQWGSFSDPHLYTFDPDRVRKEGLESLVEDAIQRIRFDPP